jgi:hypothetical protein
MQVDRLHHRLVVRRLVDHALREHRVEHLAPPLDGADVVLCGVEVVRRGDRAGEGRGLRERQVLRVLVEELAGSRLHAVGPLAEVDRVQVPREDLLLRELLLELPCERRLVDLAPERPLVADVEVLHELLGDRRAALDDAAGSQVDVCGSKQRPAIDPVVVPEALVLDRDGRILDRLRHLRVRQDDAILAGVQFRDEGAVGGVQERGLRQHAGLRVLELRKAARGGGDGHDEEAERGRAPHLHGPSMILPGICSHW